MLVRSLRRRPAGTIKSQSNAIYRRAGLRGRSELVAYCVEDLLAGERLLFPDDRASHAWRIEVDMT